MDANEVIDGAIDYITENGWCQNNLTKPDGSACMRGAMMMGAGAKLDKNSEINLSDEEFDWYRFSDAIRKVEKVIHEDTKALITVPNYNDLIATSQEDVLLVLKRAKEA